MTYAERIDLSQAIQPVQHLQLPANIPPQMLSRIFQQHFQQIQILTLPSVNYEILHATLESTRLRSEYRSRRMIGATRMARPEH
jgi:hypothetical protein